MKNTKDVIIKKAQRGWSVKEIFYWDGFLPNEGERNDDTLAWAVFNAADSAARHNMTITSITINGEYADRARLTKLIGEIASGALDYSFIPAVGSLSKAI